MTDRQMRFNLPFLVSDVDRHGNRRYYVRRFGRKIRLREEPETEVFALAYARAVERLTGPAPAKPKREPEKGTLGALGLSYFASPAFLRLDEKSRANRRAILEACFRELRAEGASETMGECPVQFLTAAKIRRLRDLKANKPGAANNRLKYLSSMCGWAVENDLLKMNPCRDVKRIDYATDGFHTWTVEEIRQFEARHPIGTKARLAIALLLYAGVRRGDVVDLGRQHIQNGWLVFVPKKTAYKRMDLSRKPIDPELQKVIDATPSGHMTFLVTEYGKPFTAKGFGGWFKDRCKEAKLPHCAAHGLRKAGASIRADLGATDRQLMAFYDWTSSAQATVYTKKADKKRLAAAAGKLLKLEDES